MNIGECPYPDCADVFGLAVLERTPAYCKIICDTCQLPVWYRLSRVDPKTPAEKEFLATHDVDYDIGKVVHRPERERNVGTLDGKRWNS